jgi:hypothetical protein
MKETDLIVEMVKKALAAKKAEINRTGISAMAFVSEAFNQRQREVIHFEQSLFQLTYPESEKGLLIEKYNRDAQELIGGISKILV